MSSQQSRLVPRFISTFSLLLAIFGSNNAMATLLSGGLNVDNGYVAYLSTDDNTAGTMISSGNNWPTTFGFSGVNLLAGQNYFLHIFAYDQGGIAGFLGQFDLTGSDHVFANASNHLTTNTLDWSVSTSGWGGYVAPTGLGGNGVGPWGFRPGVDAGAQWIWSADAHNDNEVYFSTMIKAAAVPEPATLLLLSLGLAGLSLRKIKRA